MQLYQGDCLEIMKKIPDKSIDMILCDLPYGTTDFSWDKVIPFEPLWDQYERVIKNNGAILLFSFQPFTTDLINSNRKMFRYEIVWEKTMKAGFFNANRMPLRAHENICVFYQHLPTYNPIFQKVDGKPIGRVKIQKPFRSKHYNGANPSQWVETGKRFPTDVIKFSNWNGAQFGNNSKAVKHPTQKPIDLLEYLIKTYTNEGDTVLDNCMGSGSTGVACRNTGRDFIGIELDEKFFNIAKSRINEEIPKDKLSKDDSTEFPQITLYDLEEA